MKKIGIYGAGVMGSGIAYAFASGGYPVIQFSLFENELETSMENHKRLLKREVEKGRKTKEDSEHVLSLITPSFEVSSLKDCDLIVEAVLEDVNIKKKVFQELSDIVSSTCVVATNTSTISITELASSYKNSDKCIGMHFMNPVPKMKLVEVISGLQTSSLTVDQVVSLTLQIGKEPVVVKDSPGFVLNRILIPLINEGIMCLEEGVGDAESIDKMMILGANHPMGPLALADLVGLDVCLHIMEVLYKDFGDSKYRPSPLLRRMVSAGKLGRKTKQGFYLY